MKDGHGHVQAGSFLFQEDGEISRNGLFKSVGPHTTPSGTEHLIS